MLTPRPAGERGATDLGWLRSLHSFSFGDYHDPRHMGFSHLRVLNDDRVRPGRGFGMHSHRDMEILSIVLSGALEHRDSLGNGSVIRPGEIQRMTAGTGITHGEFNPSTTEEVHFLQIWIVPERAGLAPGYEQKAVKAPRRNRPILLASRDGREGSVTIHQDAGVYALSLDAGGRVSHAIAAGRRTFVHVSLGGVDLNGTPLGAGDGAAARDEPALEFAGREAAEILIFDLA